MEKKKKFQIPTTCALLFMLMIVCAVLTWIIPAGAYETEKVGNLNKVIAGTYHVIDSTPVGPWGVLMAVMAGFYKSAKLIFMIMFCGGAVAVLEKSGSINAAFGRLASNKKLNAHVLALLIMAFMSVGGAAGVFANPVVALVPIGIILATSLGYDAFTGFLFVYMGAYSGFNVGWANATTIGVAHPIAELPIFSGFEVRVLLNIINFAICYFFTVRYMKTIRKDPMKSLNYEEGMSVADFLAVGGNHLRLAWLAFLLGFDLLFTLDFGFGFRLHFLGRFLLCSRLDCLGRLFLHSLFFLLFRHSVLVRGVRFFQFFPDLLLGFLHQLRTVYRITDSHSLSRAYQFGEMLVQFMMGKYQEFDGVFLQRKYLV